jgi:hypothetical protein
MFLKWSKSKDAELYPDSVSFLLDLFVHVTSGSLIDRTS